MLSITQFPRRFPASHKRVLLPALAARPPSSGAVAPSSSRALWTPTPAVPVGGVRTATVTRLGAISSSPPPPVVPSGPRSVTSSSAREQRRGVQTSAEAMTPSSSAALASVASQDDHEDDGFLYGERGDDWFTTDRDPRHDETFPGRDPATGRLHSIAMPNLRTCSRAEMLDYLDNTWALTDALFTTLQGEAAFMTAPPHGLRHPLIFYYGHPTVFYVNKLVVSGLLPEAVNPYYEHVFEVGVDEMRWDDMSKNEMEWPRVAPVTAYRRHVYGIVRDLIQTHPGLAPGHGQIDADSELWALCMALEHERIHLETSSMLMQEHPVEFFQPSTLLADYHASAQRPCSTKKPVAGEDYPVNSFLPVEGARVTVGKPRDFPTFGWDNEYGVRLVDVPSCEASQFLVSNGEFWQFVASGAYLEPRFWSEQGWQWRCFRNTKWPQFWVPDGPSGSHQYRLRALFDVLPMQWDWPAQVNRHEAQAFCKWKNDRDGNQDTVVYHLVTEAIHQLLRDPKDRSVHTEHDDVLQVQTQMAVDTGKNLNCSFSSFTPVDAMAPTASGFHDVFGNAWEWCEDLFSALPGFQLHAYYDDFSAPCFDGEHHVIMGGSFMSSGDNGASKFARYHFRPHFFQHAGFRVVAQPVDSETQSFTLATTCVNAPGPYVATNPYRSSETVSLGANASAFAHQTAGGTDAATLQSLFDDVYRKSEASLEQFVQTALAMNDEEASAPTATTTTMLARNGVDGALKLKDQLKRGDVLVVVSPSSDALAQSLAGEFELLRDGAVPVVTKESPTEARMAVQSVTAWKKM